MAVAATPSMDATSGVFNTYELVEDVLLYLPLRDLLLAQRISRNIRDVIRNSLPIQKALFFEPLNIKHPEDEHKPMNARDIQILPLNPFLLKFGMKYDMGFLFDDTYKDPGLKMQANTLRIDGRYLYGSFCKMLVIQAPGVTMKYWAWLPGQYLSGDGTRRKIHRELRMVDIVLWAEEDWGFPSRKLSSQGRVEISYLGPTNLQWTQPCTADEICGWEVLAWENKVSHEKYCVASTERGLAIV